MKNQSGLRRVKDVIDIPEKNEWEEGMREFMKK